MESRPDSLLIDPRAASDYSETMGTILPVIYRSGRPTPSNLTSRPGEDGVSFWDRLANPWPLEQGSQPVFRPGEPYFTVDPSQLPAGSVVPTPPEGHWIVKDVPPDRIKPAVTGRGVLPK
jgi:hypothetical protein